MQRKKSARLFFLFYISTAFDFAMHLKKSLARVKRIYIIFIIALLRFMVLLSLKSFKRCFKLCLEIQKNFVYFLAFNCYGFLNRLLFNCCIVLK